MQLVFFALLLLTLTESSSVESDLISSIDIVAFGYSQKASQHWDCPQVDGRVAKAEESRIWKTVIPDARIKEIAVASGSMVLWRAEQYRWIKMNALVCMLLVIKSDPFRQEKVVSTEENTILLGMRRPSLDKDSNAPIKVLCSKDRQLNKHALSAALPQLEHIKGEILAWMTRTGTKQTSPAFPDAALEAAAPLADLQMPHAANYHPRVFRHAHFTTGDLIAWIALAVEFHRGRLEGAKAIALFDIMVKAILPRSNVTLAALPPSHAKKPTPIVYLHRPFQYVPAGAAFAFFFQESRGGLLCFTHDLIVLTRPEGIVDGHKRLPLVLVLEVGVGSSNLSGYQADADINNRRITRRLVGEEFLHLCLPAGKQGDEAQAFGVAMIRRLAANLKEDSFLEAQRSLLESACSRSACPHTH